MPYMCIHVHTCTCTCDDLDSFVTFEALAISGRGEDSQEGVFMNQFSDNSEEGGNILGVLESQVMNTSISRYRP